MDRLSVAFAVITVIGLFSSHRALLQTISFDVASVRQNNLGPQSLSRIVDTPGSTLRLTNVSARTIVQVAYGLSVPYVVGGPSWLDDRRFDIDARAPRPSSRDELRMMLQRLLSERFGFKARFEDATGKRLELSVAREGQLGPKLHPASLDCRAKSASVPTACEIIRSFDRLHGRGLSIDVLADHLSAVARAEIVNKTGLTGFFEWDLTWFPEQFELGFDRNRFPQVDPAGPRLPDALREQLGLRLVTVTGIVRRLVIQEMSMPGPN